MKENLISKIENTIMCYEASRTEENAEAVDGIIYGLVLAVATIKGELNNERH